MPTVEQTRPKSMRTAVAVLVASATVVMTWPAAAAGDPCDYSSDPASSQIRGGEVTVSGSFGIQYPNGAITVSLRVAPGEEYVLAPMGMTSGSGAFEHTVTIGLEVPTGNYQLVTTGPSPDGIPLICSKPFTVTQLVVFVPPGGFTTGTTTTTTTTTLAPTTTTAPPATTVPPTTTGVPPPTPADAAALSTTVTSTTTSPPDAVVAGDSPEQGDESGWPTALLIGGGLGVLAVAVYLAITRRRVGP